MAQGRSWPDSLLVHSDFPPSTQLFSSFPCPCTDSLPGFKQGRHIPLRTLFLVVLVLFLFLLQRSASSLSCKPFSKCRRLNEAFSYYCVYLSSRPFQSCSPPLSLPWIPSLSNTLYCLLHFLCLRFDVCLFTIQSSSIKALLSALSIGISLACYTPLIHNQNSNSY